jgi:uncharacterized protein YndB with AHSA1/START domain
MEAIRHELWIATDTMRVFNALTTKEGLDFWSGPALAATPEIGSVVDLVPGERLTWRCITDLDDPGMPGSEWLGHRIAFELEAGSDDHGSTWLRERLGVSAQAGFAILRFRSWSSDSRWFAYCNASWSAMLDGLKRHCEITPA